MDYLITKRDWSYRWTPPPNSILHEEVKGPLTQPMLAVPFPCTFEDDTDLFNCEEEVKKCYHRRGIPDTWNEYNLVKKGCLPPDQLPKKDVKITRHLWQNYRMDFGQGIPDPWKRCVTSINADLRNYLDKPNTEMYDADKIHCPSCDKELLIYCLNEFDESKKAEPMKEKSVQVTPVQETISEEKVLKGACVETDEVEVKIDETCHRKDQKFKDCSEAEYTSCRETKQKKCRFRKEDESSDNCCSCPHKIPSIESHRGFHAPICVHNFLPFLPTNQQEMQFTSGRYQLQYQPPVNSQFPTQWQPYPCFSPGFFAIGGRRNGHFLELKLVCSKCKTGKKHRRKGKHKPANTNPQRNDCTPCRCKNEKDHSSGSFVNDDDLSSSGLYKITRVRNRSTCHCDEGTSSIAKDKQADRDFIRLLQMLGFNDLHSYERNTIYDESVVNLDPLDIVGKSKRETPAYISPPRFPNPKILNWKYPRNSQTQVRTGSKYTYDRGGKTVVYQNRKPDTIANRSTIDKTKNLDRSKEFEKKLVSFISNSDSVYSDGNNSSPSSSETEQKKTSKQGK